MAEHLALVNSGQVDKAVDFIRSHAKFPKTFDSLEESFRKGFAAIYGNNGKYDGFEFVGYKRFGSKAYQSYVMAYYENASVQFNYGFELYKGEWKWVQWGAQYNWDEMSKVTPWQIIEDK